MDSKDPVGELFAKNKSLLRYPFASTVVLDRLYEDDVRTAILEYKSLHSRWRVAKTRADGVRSED